MILVLDRNLQVVWAWDTFDRLDAHRAAVMAETCLPNAGGCPLFFLSPTANDWTHGNAVQETPDGNLLYSSRHQDWLVKIAYESGLGDGHVMWKLGKDGDFQFVSSDPYPWFSHQHDGNFITGANGVLTVFDNGNTRITAQGSGNSRGQVFNINEINRTATSVVNADLGVYSVAVGSAARVRGGGYAFDAGFVPEQNGFGSYSMEVDAAGRIRYATHQNVILYRTFRLADMYSAD
jgi:hypothetical protein